MWPLFFLSGESFFFLGNSFSGKRAKALILGVGGGAWGSGSGCANGDLFGGGSMSSGVELRSSLLSISLWVLLCFKLGLSSVVSFFCDKRVLPRYRGSIRVFLSILLPGSKTVRATGAIDVLGSFGVRGLLL